jgi:hypothetical protein
LGGVIRYKKMRPLDAIHNGQTTTSPIPLLLAHAHQICIPSAIYPTPLHDHGEKKNNHSYNSHLGGGQMDRSSFGKTATLCLRRTTRTERRPCKPSIACARLAHNDCPSWVDIYGAQLLLVSVCGNANYYFVPTTASIFQHSI